jgi:Flp pilus assembly protein TadD
MMIREGRAEAAVGVLRRARFDARPGVGEATVAYLIGRALEATGKDAQAREAYRRALDPRATAISDDGPGTGPAAADHLADLGVTAR